MRLVSLVVLAVSSLAWAPPAARRATTHATLVSSEPAANAHVAAAPERIRLVFSEPVEGSLARVTLVAAPGSTIVLRAGADPRNVNAVIATVDSLAPGRYKVDWRVVSADGHPVTGSYGFALGDTTLGASPAALPPAPPAVEEPAVADPDPMMEDDAWGPSVAGAPLIPALFRGAALGALMAAAGMLLLRVRADPNAAQVGCPRVGGATTTLLVAAPLLL